MNYTLLYSTTLMVSFALTFIFLIYHSRYWNPATHFPLQCIYMLNMASALLCIVWALVDGKPQFISVNYMGNIIEFNCLGYCGYFWLRYCLKFADIPALKTRLAKFLMLAPIGAVSLLILATPFTHWLFYIDEGGYFRRGSLYFFQQTGYIYLCVSSAICLTYRRKCETSCERRRMTILSMFPLSPAFFGGIQIFAPSGVAPTMQFSILISLILVFVNELDQKITRDSLTQLKNRYEFERVLQSRMGNFLKYGPKLYVIMSDLDDFKNINDTYGHQEGDAALRITGNVLNKTADNHGAVCARMSGDEFISLVETDSYEQAEAYVKELEENLISACADLPYVLRLSVGIAQYDGEMSVRQLLSEADDRMYDQKRMHKRAM